MSITAIMCWNHGYYYYINCVENSIDKRASSLSIYNAHNHFYLLNRLYSIRIVFLPNKQLFLNFKLNLNKEITNISIDKTML